MVLPREELLGSINLLDKDLVGTVSFNSARATSAANPVTNNLTTISENAHIIAYLSAVWGIS